MTSFLGLLSILSVLAAPGYALSCVQCASASTCSGSSVTCLSGYECGSLYTESEGAVHVVRGCTPKRECNFKGNIVLDNGKFKMATTCCNTDNCTPAPPVFVPLNSEPNGLACPSCEMANSTSCESSNTIQCTGEERRCVLWAVETTGVHAVKVAYRGCATPSVCDLGSQSITIEGTTENIKYECSGGGTSVQRGVVTPAVVCLLLLTWLL
ncbi:phospholipase A2 inhibitor and Ly6/PLAUR domain-containing protein-like [Dendropsophus ebraccatus]|uniref:phospholipase A2 inhibitor and Ly6/PLAUR domain-containing protein-like n=1 Tax=Dendropsophus ebraccatus TaxID=150705 RepID=UPI00383170FD